jgi:hypothetical protein
MTPGKQAVYELPVVISSNTGTGTIAPEWTISRWVRVVPVAETDSFDVTIKDGKGYIMVKRTGQVGTMSEMLELSLGIAKTILIESATQDGTYRVLFDLH